MKRQSSAAIDSTPSQSLIGIPIPRMSAAGVDSSASPITISAADAMLSARACLVTSRGRPKRSRCPLTSMTEGMPEHPIATPLQPDRMAWVRESAMITPTRAPVSVLISSRIVRALRSGSFGSSTTKPGGALEASTPALGSRVPPSCRAGVQGCPTISSLSALTTSASRGSMPYRSPEHDGLFPGDYGIETDYPSLSGCNGTFCYHEDIPVSKASGVRLQDALLDCACEIITLADNSCTNPHGQEPRHARTTIRAAMRMTSAVSRTSWVLTTSAPFWIRRAVMPRDAARHLREDGHPALQERSFLRPLQAAAGRPGALLEVAADLPVERGGPGRIPEPDAGIENVRGYPCLFTAGDDEGKVKRVSSTLASPCVLRDAMRNEGRPASATIRA